VQPLLVLGTTLTITLRDTLHYGQSSSCSAIIPLTRTLALED
jgi:hypothetical protein